MDELRHRYSSIVVKRGRPAHRIRRRACGKIFNIVGLGKTSRSLVACAGSKIERTDDKITATPAVCS